MIQPPASGNHCKDISVHECRMVFVNEHSMSTDTMPSNDNDAYR